MHDALTPLELSRTGQPLHSESTSAFGKSAQLMRIEEAGIVEQPAQPFDPGHAARPCMPKRP